MKSDAKLTYQQIRLMEHVSNADREQVDYLIAPIEQADSDVLVSHGYIVIETGAAKLTESGIRYIIELNTCSPTH